MPSSNSALVLYYALGDLEAASEKLDVASMLLLEKKNGLADQFSGSTTSYQIVIDAIRENIAGIVKDLDSGECGV